LTETLRGATERKDDSVSRGTPPAQTGIFVRGGEYWTVGYGSVSFSLRDLKGLSYIQRLLQHPGEEFHALDLLDIPGKRMAYDSGSADIGSVLHDPAVNIGGLGDSGEMLDARAKQDYKRRLLELREELEDLRERGADEPALKVESEIDFLEREIVRAFGLRGRDRRAGSTSERARLNVTRAIKAGLRKISEHHSTLGELLERSIRTGSFCSYVPDPRILVSWQFSSEGLKRSDEVAAAAPFLVRRETGFLRAFTEGTTFVGREAERTLLHRSLEQVLRGAGGVVLIAGAAGVGKTRIAAEFGVEASQRGILTFVGSCFDRDDPVPFLPFVEILEAALAQAPSPDAFRNVLGDDASEIARLLPQLRRLFHDIPPPMKLSPEQSQRILFSAVAKLLARTATNQPVLLVLDDLHWADERTLSLVNHLAQLVSKMPVLIVGTYRDFELQPTRPLAQAVDELIRFHLVEQISLSGLPRTAVAEMLRVLSGREPPEEVVSLIYSETEGNPFFIEELFQHLVEQGKLLDSSGEFRRDLKLGDSGVPQSLRLVIGRRLARLTDDAQKILGTAAVIGRSFTFELLEGSIQADTDSLLDCVEEAERAGLVASTVQYPEAQFRFSHELIRQAVISGLSGARRQRLHLDVADAMERLYVNALEENADDIAYHLCQAGTAADAERTIRHLAIAAKRASEQGALTKAEGEYRQALNVLARLPATPARDQQELQLQLAIGQVFIATRGYTGVETAAAYDRAGALGERLGEPIQIALALGGLFALPLLRGEMDGAQAFADRVRAVAERCGTSSTRTLGHLYEGVASYHRGKLELARDYFVQALASYREDDHRGVPPDPGVETLDYMSLTAWQLGLADSARRWIREAFTLAERVRKPYALAHNRFYAAYLNVLLRDPPACQRVSEAILEQSRNQSLPLFFDICRILRGWALAQQGHSSEGISCCREGLASFKAVGNRLSIGSFLGFLAESLAKGGKLEEALATVEEGMAEVGEQLVDLPYLLWLRGELLLQRAGGSSITSADSSTPLAVDSAERSFRDSISFASRLGAKSYGLRAATSLARLLTSCGRSVEAHELLVPLWKDFVEGFDTRDLIDAKKVVG
jgi:tetratricopeptide (TPR) repeat protein